MSGLHTAAAELASAAGEALLALRAGWTGDQRALRDAGDRASHDLLTAALAERFPADAVLSEEGADDPARLQAERVWIVDPLDGTREYGEGRSDWAVHVACWERGELVAGAVALPGLGEVLATPSPTAGGRRAAHDGAPRLVVSRTRPPAFTEAVAAAVGGELVAMGSAGAKAMAVVRGEAEVYAHAGGQYEWDSAAPAAVAQAAGLHVSRIDGSLLRYNQPDPWLPDLLVCLPELADAVLAAANRHSGEASPP